MRACLLLVLLTVASSFPDAASAQRRSNRSSDAIASNPIAAIIDEDKDGVLSPREIRFAANQIRKLDTNKDGKITAAELGGSDDQADEDEELDEVDAPREERPRPNRSRNQPAASNFSDPYYADLNQQLVEAILEAGKLYQQKKYDEAGIALEDAMDVIEEVDDPAELLKMSKSISRLSKAHQMIAKEGVDLPQLPDFKSLVAGSVPANARGNGNAGQSEPEAEPEETGISFTREVAPILVKRCASCHIDKDEPEADVSFASYSDLINGGVVDEGNADNSILIDMVVSGDMPPKKPLSEKEIQLLTEWVDEGARFDGDNAGKQLK